MANGYLDAILKLPVADRLDLVEAIWDSLADSPEAEAAFALTDEQRAELDRRLEEHLQDPSSAIPWEEVRRRLAGGLDPPGFLPPSSAARVVAGEAVVRAQRSGLGEEFEAEVERVVATMARSPLLFPRVSGETRRALARRFPYGLFFHCLPGEVIVLSCYYLRRRPRRWRGRPR